MKIRPSVICFSVLVFIFTTGLFEAMQASTKEKPKGQQETRRYTAELFLPGIVSTGFEESAPVFSPDQRELYYAIDYNGFSTIVVSSFSDDGWSKPEVAPFSGNHLDGNPAFHPDGSRLYFASNRPLDGTNGPSDDINIWYVSRIKSGWSEPKPLEGPVNSTGFACCPSLTRSGTMYFARKLEGGGEGIFRSRMNDGVYAAVEQLPAEVNSTSFQTHCVIAADERYLLLVAAGRDDSIGAKWNYYVTFRDKNDRWSSLINLGEMVNSRRIGAYLSLSPDGRHLFFQARPQIKPVKFSDQKLTYQDIVRIMMENPANDRTDIFRIDAGLIEDLRPAGF